MQQIDSKNQPVIPLTLEESPIPAPSQIERVGLFIPILGWIVSNFLYRKRILPAWESLDAQFLQRSGPCDWTAVEVESGIILEINNMIKDCFSWPTPWFHPLDPMELIMFEDDLRSIELQRAIVDKYNLDECFYPPEKQVFRMHLSEFIASIAEQISERS